MNEFLINFNFVYLQLLKLSCICISQYASLIINNKINQLKNMIGREMIRLMPFDKIKSIFLFALPNNNMLCVAVGPRVTEEIHQAQSRDRHRVEIFRYPGSSSPKGNGSDREIAPSSPMDRDGTCC